MRRWPKTEKQWRDFFLRRLADLEQWATEFMEDVDDAPIWRLPFHRQRIEELREGVQRAFPEKGWL
jgi:hypothetical protein